MAIKRIRVICSVEISIPDELVDHVDDYTVRMAVDENISFEGHGSIDWTNYVGLEEGEVESCDLDEVMVD